MNKKQEKQTDVIETLKLNLDTLQHNLEYEIKRLNTELNRYNDNKAEKRLERLRLKNEKLEKDVERLRSIRVNGMRWEDAYFWRYIHLKIDTNVFYVEDLNNNLLEMIEQKIGEMLANEYYGGRDLK